MNDYEKFDQYLDDGKFKDDFSELHQITDLLRNKTNYPSPLTEKNSKAKFLAEAESIQTDRNATRVRRLGAVFAWAVPAILILVLAGVIFGNGPNSGGAEIQTGSGAEQAVDDTEVEQQDDGVLAPAVEITPTRFVTEDGPGAESLPGGLQDTSVISPTEKNGETITIPGEDGNPVELINPAVPVNGGAGQPIDTQEGEGQSDSTGGQPPDQ